MRPLLARLVKSRAVHFLLLGGVLFAVTPKQSDPRRIAISSRDLDALHAAQAQRLGVPALPTEQRDAIDARAIEDDVLYREALRLGLDRGDAVLRQYLVQKMLLRAEDLGGAMRTPTEDELHAYFASTRDRWTRERTIHFVHVFATRRAAINALAADVSRENGDAPPPLGEAFPMSRDVSSPETGVALVFGESFADAVSKQPIGTWSAPLESKHGFHLVKVLEKGGGRPATYDEVHGELALAWAVDARREAVSAFLKRAFERYDVEVDGTRTVATLGPARIARRQDPSGED
jgi:hypothetical protein